MLHAPESLCGKHFPDCMLKTTPIVVRYSGTSGELYCHGNLVVLQRARMAAVFSLAPAAFFSKVLMPSISQRSVIIIQ